jgi:hypothetical protein
LVLGVEREEGEEMEARTGRSGVWKGKDMYDW